MANSDKAIQASIVCPVCESTTYKKLRNCKNRANPFWRKCAKCKTVYARETPSAEILSQYYENYYNANSPEVPTFVTDTLRKVFSRLESFRSNLNRILDIGFGVGVFLDVASEKKWSCHGTEFSQSSVEMALKKGWAAHFGELTEVDLVGPYDVISAIEVLEHVSSPEVIIKQASVRLRKGGAFYGTTPNGGSLNLMLLGESWSVLSYPEHQVLLNSKSLSILLSKNNLDCVFIKTKGINPADLLNSFKVKKLPKSGSTEPVCNRVNLGYSINSVFERNSILELVKRIANFVLNFCKIGDSLEFLAER